MKSILALLAFVACVTAEPPSGYSYQQPSVVLLGGHDGFDGFSNNLGLGGGGSYHAVPAGYQSNEGQYVDPHLLEEIKHILLKDEQANERYSSSSHGISSVYGAPSPVYGVPHYSERVVGIELGRVKQGIQVAQFEQGHGGSHSGGYIGGGSIGGGYIGGGSIGGGSVHSISDDFSSHGSSIGHSNAYTTISIPAGSYGVPLPLSKYGAPHH